MNSSSSRRTLLAAAAGLPAAAAASTKPVLTTGAPQADAELLELCARAWANRAEAERLMDASEATADRAESDALFERACALNPEFSELRDAIAATPPRTLQGLREKARFVVHHCENEDHVTARIVGSFVREVLALTGGGAA